MDIKAPLRREQLRGGSLTGNGVALAVGVVGSLLAGLGVVLETEKSFDRVWDVPDEERHGFLGSRLRATGLLVALGGCLAPRPTRPRARPRRGAFVSRPGSLPMLGSTSARRRSGT